MAPVCMSVIQPNCRAQFAAEDIEFVVSVLGRKLGDAECLVRLLADEDSRDLILDDEDLFRALLERGGCLRVSTRLYFYVLVRHVFNRSGLPNRNVADYVAEVLSEFARIERGRCMATGQGNPADYLFEMISALAGADQRNTFLIRLHVGNYSLFLSGVFPDRIRSRSRTKGFPDLAYYEAMGRTQYRLASDHQLARRYAMEEILGTLSERFEVTRLALNDVASRLFFLGDSEPGLIG